MQILKDSSNTRPLFIFRRENSENRENRESHGTSEPNANLTLSLPESNLELINMVLTFQSVDETLVCDHSNERY